jgi:signal transduction histidine kinase
LKWLTTIVPAFTVYFYETVRHALFEQLMTTAVGNLFAGLIVLALAFAFSETIFGFVERLQREEVAHSRKLATLNATIEERERMSRELHDGLAQVIAYLLVRIDTVASLVEAERKQEALGELDRLRTVAADLYSDVRESISTLRTRITEGGLRRTLLDYLTAFEERNEIQVDLQADPLLDRLTPPVAYQVFRIVQEALANVRKHARAQQAVISVTTSSPELLVLTITDDGQGFDPAAAGGPELERFGLIAMRERAASFAGSLNIASTAPGGTRVSVTIPLRPRVEVNGAALAPASG